MKYPNWNEYDNAKKWRATADELKLETNNGTTKSDLLNIVKFLAREAVNLQAKIYKFEEEIATILAEQKYCEKCFYNKAGLCLFDADKEEINMYTACYNAALEWVTEYIQGEGSEDARDKV